MVQHVKPPTFGGLQFESWLLRIPPSFLLLLWGKWQMKARVLGLALLAARMGGPARVLDIRAANKGWRHFLTLVTASQIKPSVLTQRIVEVTPTHLPPSPMLRGCSHLHVQSRGYLSILLPPSISRSADNRTLPSQPSGTCIPHSSRVSMNEFPTSQCTEHIRVLKSTSVSYVEFREFHTCTRRLVQWERACHSSEFLTQVQQLGFKLGPCICCQCYRQRLSLLYHSANSKCYMYIDVVLEAE